MNVMNTPNPRFVTGINLIIYKKKGHNFGTLGSGLTTKSGLPIIPFVPSFTYIT